MLPAATRDLVERWRDAGGGQIVVAPYVFSWVVTLQSKPWTDIAQTWLERAEEIEPALFPEGHVWHAHPDRPDVDYPNSVAFRMNKAALNRYLQRLAFECKELRVQCAAVVQISNGVYDDIAAADGVWQERALKQFPEVMAKLGFVPRLQLEACTGTACRTPAIDCPVLTMAKQQKETELSVFDSALALTTQPQTVACAGGAGL